MSSIKIQRLPNYPSSVIEHGPVMGNTFLLHAACSTPTTIAPGQRYGMPVGLKVELPDGFEGQVTTDVALARDFGVIVLNSPGTIDADYRGEVVAILHNLGNRDVLLEPGMVVARFSVHPVVRANFVEVDGLSTSARGEGGLGSTGR